MEKCVTLTVLDSIATITLNRPEVHNAFNEEVVREMTRSFEELGASPEVRVVLIASVGKTFSAGADIEHMKRIARFSEEENFEDARRLAGMFQAVRESPKPVVARVQGSAFGGGIGLIAACDIAVALNSAVFSFSEVKLGIIPAVITPYLLEKTREGPLRRYALTGDPFSAEEALRIGLVSETAHSITKLNERTTEICCALRANSPNAMAAYKKLLSRIEGRDREQAASEAARALAEIRRSPEAQEKLAAFLEKRKPHF